MTLFYNLKQICKPSQNILIGFLLCFIVFAGLGAAAVTYKQLIGPNTATTPNGIVRWNDAGGVRTKDSSATVDDSGNITMNNGTFDTITATTSITAGQAVRSYQGSLTHSGTITLDFDGATTVNAVTLTGAPTFATSNLATNRTYRLKITCDGSARTPTFPAWKWPGGAPTVLTASKVSILSLEAWGTTDSTVIAAFAEEQ